MHVFLYTGECYLEILFGNHDIITTSVIVKFMSKLLQLILDGF